MKTAKRTAGRPFSFSVSKNGISLNDLVGALIERRTEIVPYSPEVSENTVYYTAGRLIIAPTIPDRMVPKNDFFDSL